MDTYKKSRNEVRASRQAKEALEILSKDFESMVSRRDGNPYEWLYAVFENIGASDKTASGVGIANKSQLIFFTGATDRYNGDIGGTNDKGGDVSAVGYRLVYKDQISGEDDDKLKVFSLYRRLVDPDETFEKLLAKEKLEAENIFTEAADLQAEHFLVENIYEFTVTFLVEYLDGVVTKIERVTIRQGSSSPYTELRLKGDKITVKGGKGDIIENGQIVGVELSISVITDQGLVMAKHMKSDRWNEDAAKYTYHYTKTINTPRP